MRRWLIGMAFHPRRQKKRNLCLIACNGFGKIILREKGGNDPDLFFLGRRRGRRAEQPAMPSVRQRASRKENAFLAMVLPALNFPAGGTLAIKYGAGGINDKSMLLADVVMDLGEGIAAKVNKSAAIHAF